MVVYLLIINQKHERYPGPIVLEHVKILQVRLFDHPTTRRRVQQVPIFALTDKSFEKAPFLTQQIVGGIKLHLGYEVMIRLP